MPTLPASRRTTSALAALTLAGAAVAGCSSSGGSEAKKPSKPQASASPSSSPSGPTKPGSQLAFGGTATVPYQVDGKNTTLRLSVRSVTESTMKDFRAYRLNGQTKSSTPYYVRYSIQNTAQPSSGTSGTSAKAAKRARKARSIGGRGVPLYALTSKNTLVQSSSFTNEFKPCTSERLAKKFGPGRSQRGCLVFLLPKKVDLVGVSYRPDMKVDGIVWKGQVATKGDARQKPAKKPGAQSSKKPADKSGSKSGDKGGQKQDNTKGKR